MKEIFKQTLISVVLGLGFMVLALVILANDDFNGFMSMMSVSFFNFAIALYEAADAIYDKLLEIEKKLDAEQ